MIPVGTAVGYLTLDYTQFSNNLKTAISEATSLSGKFSDTMGRGLTTVGNKITGIGKMFTTGITMPIGTATVSAIKFGSEFEKQMSTVQAVSNATEQDMYKMRDAAISWGEKTVYSATEAGKALYYMGLAGWEPKKSIAALGPVLNLAAAGSLDLAETSDIVTDAMTAMGYEAGKLTKGIENTTYFTNSLAATMSNSNTDIYLLGEAFKYVSPLAGSLNMDINDLSLALGLMANVGVKGTQAGTGLRQALKNLISPTESMQDSMTKYGISLFDANGKAKDMRVFMKELRKTFGDLDVDIYDVNGELKTGEQIMEEYGSSLPTTQQEELNAVVSIFGTRALPGILGIINQSEENFNNLADAIDNSNDAFVLHNGTLYTMNDALSQFGEQAIKTEEGFKILGAAEGMAMMQMDNLQGDWTRFTSALGTTKILINDIVKNSLRDFVQKLTELVQWFNSLDEEQKKHILSIAAAVAAIGPLLIIFGKTISTIGNIIISFNKMSEAFNLIRTGSILLTTKIKNIFEAISLAKAGFTGLASEASPLGAAIGGLSASMLAVIAVVVALIAAFAHLWKTNEEFRDKIKGIWDGIVKNFSDAGNKITDAINSLGFDFSGLGEAIYAAWDWICNALSPVITEIFNNIGRLISGVIDTVVGVVQIITGVIKGFKDGDWSLFLEGIATLWKGIWTRFTSPFVAVFNVLTGYLDKFGLSWRDVWNSIKDFFVGIWKNVKTLFINIWNGILNFITSVLNTIKNKINTVFNNVRNFINTILTAVYNIIYKIWDGIKTFILNVLDTIKIKISTKFDAIKTFIKVVMQTIQTIISNIWNAIKKFIENIVENIKLSVSTKFEALKKIVTNIIDTLKNNVKNKINELKTSFLSIVENIKTSAIEKFTSMKNKLVNILGSLKEKVKSKTKELKEDIIGIFSNIKAKFEEVGGNIISGIKNGISKGWESLTGFVKEKSQSLLDTAKDALGINSPSKKFNEEVGKNIPLGILEGFYSTLPKVLDNMENYLDNSVDKFDIQDIDIIGLSYNFKNVVTDVADWFVSIEEKLAYTVNNIKTDLANLIGIGNMIINSDGTISGIVVNKHSDSLDVGLQGKDSDYGNAETINNFTFYSNEPIDEIKAAKLLKETQRDLAEGYL